MTLSYIQHITEHAVGHLSQLHMHMIINISMWLLIITVIEISDV